MAYEKVTSESKYPDAVQFKFEAPGDEVEGVLLEKSDDIDGDFGTYQLWTLQSEEDDVIRKVLLGGVLRDKASRADGKVGDAFKFVFKGKVQSKTNKTRLYNDYDVFIDRRSPKSDWDDKEAF